MKVSRRYTAEDLKNNKASLLDVYEDYVTGYVLGVAERIAKEEHSEIAVVILVTSIFEPLGAMLRGVKKGTDSDRFCEGLQFVFGSIPGAARVYKLLRHGLYHQGFLKAGLILVAEGEPISEDGGMLRINVGAFLRKASQQFHVYVEDVRRSGPDSAQTRNFMAFWENMQDLKSRDSGFDSSLMPSASTAGPILASSSRCCESGRNIVPLFRFDPDVVDDPFGEPHRRNRNGNQQNTQDHRR
jgi:hypothetical protein